MSNWKRYDWSHKKKEPDDDNVELPPIPTKFCEPGWHTFKKKLYFNIYTWECKMCDLNLHYDKNTDAYKTFESYQKLGNMKWPWEKKNTKS